MQITRRDFIQGTAIAVSASALGAFKASAQAGVSDAETVSYPPAKTGLRGSAEGSYETFHEMSWRGDRKWPAPNAQTDSTYDLAVVGAGVSGLAAAYFYRKGRPDAKILVLDNNDDFGGHARRNEFEVDGRSLLAAGGSVGLSFPDIYSPEAIALIEDIGVRWKTFPEEHIDEAWHARHGLVASGLHFTASSGKPSTILNPLGYSGTFLNPEELKRALDALPLAPKTREMLFELITDEPEILPGKSAEEKEQHLARISYTDYLRNHVGLPEDGIRLLRNLGGAASTTGVGWDAVAADVAATYYLIGLRNIVIKRPLTAVPKSTIDAPFNVIYPDGNATVTRLLVRHLIPAVAPGIGASDKEMIDAKLEYGALDQPDHGVRMRLNSTVVRATHAEDGRYVDVVYIKSNRAERVRARHAIMANWHQTLPYICPELGDAQKAALASQQKAPMAMASVALRNWRPMAQSGYAAVSCPQSFYDTIAFPNPVNLGTHRPPASPDEPVVLDAYHFTKPSEPRGLSAREQHRLARHTLLDKPFAEYEKLLLGQMAAIWGEHGFDPNSVAAITLNRWPHGYTPTWNPLFDAGESADSADAPHVISRSRVGRISIANSDAEGQPLLQAGIDAAFRAVRQQLG